MAGVLGRYATDREIFVALVAWRKAVELPDNHVNCFYLAVRDKDRKFGGWSRKMVAPSLVLVIVSPSVSA